MKYYDINKIDLRSKYEIVVGARCSGLVYTKLIIALKKGYFKPIKDLYNYKKWFKYEVLL